MSAAAIKLLEAMQDFIDQSSEIDYVFSFEEQWKIERMINVLNKQIEMLIDYEIRNRKEK